MLKVNSYGPFNARIMLVGEAPGFEEEIAGRPFIGESGKELRRQLKEVGINMDDCYITNVCKYRPPANEMSKWITDKKTVGMKAAFVEKQNRWIHPLVEEGLLELQREIHQVNPEVIIGFGNTPLWALTGNWGIGNWRGSELLLSTGHRFVPTYHPAAILRAFHNRPQVIQDLSYRVKRRLDYGFITPKYEFKTAPTFDEVMLFLNMLAGKEFAADTETMNGHIVCLGIADSPTRAMCIPFINEAGVYWNEEERKQILLNLQAILEIPGTRLIGQNWNYDAQYFEEDFGWTHKADFDTYIAQSVLFPGSERGLGYLSSIYCNHHVYWKDDGKEWAKGIKNFQKEFIYNCHDCCATFEVSKKQQMALEGANLQTQMQERLRYSYTVYSMMREGVNRDPQRTAAMVAEIEESIQERTLAVNSIVGYPVNIDSPKQVSTMLYKEMGLQPVGKRTASGAASTNDEALTKLVEKYPVAKEVCTAILEARSLRTIKSTFLEAELDPDGKLRSSWAATGTETFRLTSSKNAFHRGGPLQNITDGKHTHSGRPLPNLRSTIVPDPGYTIFNCDLERADLQVVAWEAEDADLKQKLREHVDIHTENAKELFGLNAVTEQQRHFGKTFVHLTNYGGGARTCAIKTHCTVHEAELRQRRWFQIHPGIKQWHEQTLAQLYGTRTIRNKFGYRRVYFDRVDGLLPEALAWVPQSTVGILISLMQMAMEEQVPEATIFLQVHDSVVGQYRMDQEDIILPKLLKASQIAVPYSDPLYIPLDLATSTSSWGEVQKREWP